MKQLHHIIPVHTWDKCYPGCTGYGKKRSRKHTCGLDHPDNLIELTTEEHAEAHKQLWLMNHDPLDELAYLCLSGQIGREEARIASVRLVCKDKPLSDDHRAKLSKSHDGIDYGPEHAEKGRINALNRPDEVNVQIGKTMKEYIETHGKPKGFGGSGKDNPFFGKHHSEKNTKAHSARMKGRTWSKDPVTGKRVWSNP